MPGDDIMKKGTIGVVSLIIGALGGAVGVEKLIRKEKKEIQNMSDKHLALFMMMNQWVKIKQEGKSLTSYFDNNGYKRIAIYGMSYAGKTLVDELKNSEIQIEYGIDQRADNIYSDIPIVTLEDTLIGVDAIIVTAITYFEDIQAELSNKVECPIISLEDILYEM